MAAVRKLALPLNNFTYTYKGKTYECKDKECLLTADSVRSHCDYGLSYYWATFQTSLPDGRDFGVVMADGIGSKYTQTDRATEDFISLGGKVHKLGQTRLVYN